MRDATFVKKAAINLKDESKDETVKLLAELISELCDEVLMLKEAVRKIGKTQ